MSVPTLANESRQAKRSCAAIIPAYNEERAIEETIARVRRICAQIPDWDFEIICVNDGSSDRTAEILDTLTGITVLTHSANRGYGAALRTGLDYCQNDWIFIVDADGTYPLEDLVGLLSAADGGADMVVGSRSGQGITYNPFRRVARWMLRKMVHGLTGVMVPDLNSGMRLFRKVLYDEFRHLLPLGFSFTTTLTVASLYSGRQVRYIPVNYSRRIGSSSIKPVRDFLAFVILIIRLASYFEPLRFFLPLSFALLGLAIIRGIRDVVVSNVLGGLAVTLLFGALQIFVLGVIADVIVRRSQLLPRGAHRQPRPADSRRTSPAASDQSTQERH